MGEQSVCGGSCILATREFFVTSHESIAVFSFAHLVCRFVDDAAAQVRAEDRSAAVIKILVGLKAELTVTF